MKSPVRSILASALAVCVSQAALGASVIPHTSIPGLVDFGVPFTQNGTVVMSEKYDVFRPNREVSDSIKLRPNGYADFVEYHVNPPAQLLIGRGFPAFYQQGLPEHR